MQRLEREDGDERLLAAETDAAAEALTPMPSSQSATGPLKAASPTMPLSMPMDVMPT